MPRDPKRQARLPETPKPWAVEGSRFGIEGSGFTVQGFGSTEWGLGSWVLSLGYVRGFQNHRGGFHKVSAGIYWVECDYSRIV